MKGGGEKVFKGKAILVDENQFLPQVVPYLIDAMLTDFPGQSGKTKSVSIPVKRE